jgi:hypothetical protein
MKLSVSYNVFDGLELLEPSLENIRPCVDHISIVYQKVSNYLQKTDFDFDNYFDRLKNKNLFDDISIYIPTFPRPVIVGFIGARECHWNEIRKRKFGLELARKNSCTHFLPMDVDEFYDREQFLTCKKMIEENGWDSTACSIQDYYSRPIYRVKELANYFVPFIQSVGMDMEVDAPYFVKVDPARRFIQYKNEHLFSEKEIIMHHMTTCRQDKKSLESKYMNSSARINFKNIPLMINNILEFNPGKDLPQVEIVEDEFKIEKYWKTI